MLSKNSFPTSKKFENNCLTKKEFENDWFVFHTAPRSEKVVSQELVNRKYEMFLPMTKTLRIWQNRQRKMIDKVLFPSYIFENTTINELFNINPTPKIATYIHCAGKPSIVPAKDIEGIKKILNLNHEVSVEANFREVQGVRVLHGPLTGYESVLIEQKERNRLGIQLKQINQTILFDICTSVLEKICNN